MTPLEFASAIMAYCAATGGSVTSWGRTPTHNHKVGGVSNSYHLLWMAADVVYDQGDPPVWRDAIAKRAGLIIIRDETDHDHLQPA